MIILHVQQQLNNFPDFKVISIQSTTHSIRPSSTTAGNVRQLSYETIIIHFKQYFFTQFDFEVKNFKLFLARKLAKKVLQF